MNLKTTTILMESMAMTIMTDDENDMTSKVASESTASSTLPSRHDRCDPLTLMLPPDHLQF